MDFLNLNIKNMMTDDNLIQTGAAGKGCTEAEYRLCNTRGHEASCRNDTPKNDERCNETAVDEDAPNTLERKETEFLQLVKMAQTSLANKCWKDCEFTYCYDDSERSVYIYREKCPESFFCEFSMFHLLMSYVDVVGGAEGRWVPYAARAASYLHRLSHDICNGELAYFYLKVADWYEWGGNGDQALWHRKRGVAYQLKAGKMVLDNIKALLYEMEGDEALHFCLYVMSHICEQGCFGEDEFYVGWNREHYVLVEYLLKCLVYNEKSSVFIRSLILFLKAVYWKRTRRFVLAETAFEDYLSLPESDEDYRCIHSDTIYALLGECYLHDGNKERAEASFQKFRSRENVKTLPPNEEQADGWNQDLYDAIVIYCC